MYNDEHEDPERRIGFLTNFQDGLRKRFAFYLAGTLTGCKVSIKNNCTDRENRPLSDPACRALYVLPRGDKSKYWRVERRIEKMLGIR